MKALIKRSRFATIWRAGLVIPISAILLILNQCLFFTLSGIDGFAAVLLKQWVKTHDTISVAPNLLTKLAWVLVYAPFIILSTLILLLFLPLWFTIKPFYQFLCKANVAMLMWIEYRAAKAKDSEFILKAIEETSEELKKQGMTQTEIDSVVQGFKAK